MDDTTPDNSLTVDAAGSFKLPDYSIDPADQALADEIQNFDLASVPSTVKANGAIRLPEKLKATMLPPDLQKPILERLKSVSLASRDEVEGQLVLEALNQSRMDLLVRNGPGAGSDVYQREFFAIARDRRNLEKEFFDIANKLAEVEKWEPEYDGAGRPVIDPQTGQQRTRAFNRVTGHNRQQLEGRMGEVERAIGALEGFEGKQRLSGALQQAVEQRKAVQEQLEDAAEVKRRAAAKVREQRIEERAERRASRLRAGL